MPSPPETIDERFDEIVAQLRAAQPTASPELRERVRVRAQHPLAAEPAPARSRPRRARWTLVLVPAILVALAAGAVLGQRSSRDAAVSEEAAQAPPAALKPSLPGQRALDPESAAAGDSTDQRARSFEPAPRAALPPSRTRLQDYRVDLRVRVRDRDELARATAQAMRATRSLRGFVVAARFETPRGEEGDSLLVVRVPISRVQDAIARFAQLGTIVSQEIAIEDLQQSFNRESEQIRALLRTIEALQRDLRKPGLSDEERAELRFRLANVRAELRARTESRENLVRRGRLARVALTLTTRDAAPAPPAEPGKFEQTLRDALSLLGTIVTWLLAGLIVAAPFLLLAVLAVALERRRRRVAEERLLARPAP